MVVLRSVVVSQCYMLLCPCVWSPAIWSPEEQLPIFFLFLFSLFCNCTVRQRWSPAHNFGGYSLFNSTFICFKDTSSYDQFSLFNSVFLCFSLVTIKRQSSYDPYDPGILRQCYGNVSQFALGFEGKMERDLIVLLPDHCLS